MPWRTRRKVILDLFILAILTIILGFPHFPSYTWNLSCPLGRNLAGLHSCPAYAGVEDATPLFISSFLSEEPFSSVSKRLTTDHHRRTLTSSVQFWVSHAYLLQNTVPYCSFNQQTSAFLLLASRRAGIRLYILYLTNQRRCLELKAIRFPCQCRQ